MLAGKADELKDSTVPHNRRTSGVTRLATQETPLCRRPACTSCLRTTTASREFCKLLGSVNDTLAQWANAGARTSGTQASDQSPRRSEAIRGQLKSQNGADGRAVRWHRRQPARVLQRMLEGRSGGEYSTIASHPVLASRAKLELARPVLPDDASMPILHDMPLGEESSFVRWWNHLKARRRQYPSDTRYGEADNLGQTRNTTRQTSIEVSTVSCELLISLRTMWLHAGQRGHIRHRLKIRLDQQRMTAR